MLFTASIVEEFEGAEEKVNLYRLDRSRRVMEVNPHAAQMEVALEEKAEVKVMRGPNSTTSEEVSLAEEANADFSNCNPSRSNVSRNNHSRRCVDTSSRVSSLS